MTVADPGMITHEISSFVPRQPGRIVDPRKCYFLCFLFTEMAGRSCMKAGLRLVKGELAHESCNLWNRLPHSVGCPSPKVFP